LPFATRRRLGLRDKGTTSSEPGKGFENLLERAGITNTGFAASADLPPR